MTFSNTNILIIWHFTKYYILNAEQVNMHPYSNLCKITQLSSIESHCVDCLFGPENSMKPSSCNSNNGPAFQGLRKHLGIQSLD